MSSSRAQVVICGNYGATNVGDELLLEGILALTKKAQVHATVLSTDPGATASLHMVDAAPLFPAGLRSLWRGLFKGELRKTLQALRAADVFVLGGGGLFTDEKLRAVLLWWLQARVARYYKLPLVCLGQSVGPLRTWLGRFLTRQVYKQAVAVTVRDEASVKMLWKLGVRKVTALSDPAFAIMPEDSLVSNTEPYVVLSLRPWIQGDTDKLYEELARFIEWLWKERHMKTILIPFQIVKDNDLCELTRLRQLVSTPQAVHLFSYTQDHHELMALMARATAVVGMRLHSLILATMVATPFIGLAYSNKVRSFAAEMGMEDFIVDFVEMDFQELLDRFEELIEERDDVRVLLREQRMQLHAKALEHGKILEEVIRKAAA